MYRKNRIAFMLSNGQLCSFRIDDVVISYDKVDTKTVCDELAGEYRFGFQGQEEDDEIKGEGNSVNFKFRMHDQRLGRFFAVDPLTITYPVLTPYQFSSNSPVYLIELEGLEGILYTYKKTYTDKGPVIKSLGAKVVEGLQYDIVKTVVQPYKQPNGKLYVSYPMVESLTHFQGEKEFKHLKVLIKADISYKEIVEKEAFKEYKQLKKYTFEMWSTLVKCHLMKLNYIVSDIYELPLNQISSLEIFQKQLEKYITVDSRVGVLSAFPVFLFDYYGVQLKELL